MLVRARLVDAAELAFPVTTPQTHCEAVCACVHRRVGRFERLPAKNAVTRHCSGRMQRAP